MTERNLIREGFVFNTRTPAGTVSGSQIVSPGEINALVDENTGSTAFTVSGTKFTVLDADLGARWKLNRIELYSAESSASNFTMQISDNNLDFSLITMTGSTGLWVGDISPLVASGSPRYIRYKHSPAVNTIVREWKAINDQTLLDFGADGNQTSLFVDDAPIGRPSEVVETLLIKNNFSQPAQGVVFVDRTFNDAENELEISTSPSGPWVGRKTSQLNQPDIVPWEKGVLFNTRVVPSGLAIFSFTNGQANGWSSVGATQTFIGGALRGTTTNQSPRTYISSEFVPLTTAALFSTAKAANDDKFVLRAVEADTVKVRAKVLTPLQVSNLVEGPRLFWKTEQNLEASADAFRSSLSVQSTAGNSPFTGQIQEFTFPVASVPTWSGSIRGFAFQPFTVATGTNIVYDFLDLEVFHSDSDRVLLDFNPISSGTFNSPFDQDAATEDPSSRIALSVRHRVAQDCIITKVKAFVNKTGGNNTTGICLARRRAGGNFPSPGSNFSVPYAVSFFDGGSVTVGSVLAEAAVYWQAQKGDFVAIFQPSTGATPPNGFRYSSGETNDAFVSPTITGGTSLTSLTAFENALNQNNFSPADRNYLVTYDALATEQGGYKATGTYQTPVFDIGLSPTLAMLDFDTTTPGGTSIDTLGQSGFDSVRARASDTPAAMGLRLGEAGLVDGFSPTGALILNQDAIYNQTPANEHQINAKNATLSTTENTYVQNIGASVLYHKIKDELWVLSSVISGTNPFVNTDARLTWDVFTPDTFEFIRTQHITGDLTYGYDGTNVPTGSIGGSGNNTNQVAPVVIVADYSRQEIYIIQKMPALSIGAGSYYGLILDLNGKFKDVFWRSTTLGFSLVSGFAERQMTLSRGVAYAENLQDLNVVDPNANGVFFVLHDISTSPASLEDIPNGQFITALRNGNDSGVRNIGVINTTTVSSIAGLGFVASGNTYPAGLAYNPNNGLLYLLFDNLTGVASETNRHPEFLTLLPSFNVNTSNFEYTLTSVSGTAFDTGRNFDGFSKRTANENLSSSPEGSTQDWNGIKVRAPDFTMGLSYNDKRDSFYILRNYVAKRENTFPSGLGGGNTGGFNRRSYSILLECGAGTRTRIVNPAIPSTRDFVWGTLSGTLSFQDIASEGVNFPTGRYTQIEYQLNSNGAQTFSPALDRSNIAQGLNIGTIPPGGTQEISVRTNIPAGQEIGDQQGRIKAYWESQET